MAKYEMKSLKQMLTEAVRYLGFKDARVEIYERGEYGPRVYSLSINLPFKVTPESVSQSLVDFYKQLEDGQWYKDIIGKKNEEIAVLKDQLAEYYKYKVFYELQKGLQNENNLPTVR